jgi:hypothetical protein
VAKTDICPADGSLYVIPLHYDNAILTNRKTKDRSWFLCFYNNLKLISQETTLLLPASCLARDRSGQRSYP